MTVTEIKSKLKDRLSKAIKASQETNNLDESLREVNKIVDIHSTWIKEVNKVIALNDFSDVNGIEWNEFYHDFTSEIERNYHEAKDKYHDLHWNEKEFNAY